MRWLYAIRSQNATRQPIRRLRLHMNYWVRFISNKLISWSKDWWWSIRFISSKNLAWNFQNRIILHLFDHDNKRFFLALRFAQPIGGGWGTRSESLFRKHIYRHYCTVLRMFIHSLVFTGWTLKKRISRWANFHACFLLIKLGFYATFHWEEDAQISKSFCSIIREMLCESINFTSSCALVVRFLNASMHW